MTARTIGILALLTTIAAVLMQTVISVPESMRDFTWGLAGGLAIGTIVAWFARRGSSSIQP